MYLGNFIKGVNKKFHQKYFSGISFDSKKIKKDNIFFAIKGIKVDGNNFILSAIKNGAKIIVTEKKKDGLKNDILFIRSKNVRKLLAEISFKIYNNIPKNIIAVTGTNGKSSIADFYYQILDLNKKKVASIGTLGVKSKNLKMNLLNTTIDPIKLSKILSNLKKQNIDNVIMEASSHGLDQKRLDGVYLTAAAFTNFTHDHLDYHETFDAYFNSKLGLFERVLSPEGSVIINMDDPKGLYILLNTFFVNIFDIDKSVPDLYFVNGKTHKFSIVFLLFGYLYSKYSKKAFDIILF